MGVGDTTRFPAPRAERRPKQEDKPSQIAPFQADDFAKTIQTLGLTFRWSRAIECPCSMTDSDQFNPACPRCKGDGWWYVNPAQYDEPHATRDYLELKCVFGATGKSDTEQKQPGEWTSGEATMTFQGHLSVGYRDRFIGIEQRMSRTETLLRGGDRAAGSIVAVGKGRRTTGAQLEAMRYEPIHVSFVADDTGAGTIYYPRRDFVLLEPQLTEPSRLRWLPGRGPAVGDRFAIHYDFRPVWVVEESPHSYTSALPGPEKGSKGPLAVRELPTVWKVLLDFLTPARGA